MKTIPLTRGDKPDVKMCLRCGGPIVPGTGKRKDGYCCRFCRSQARLLRAKMNRGGGS
jgi:ribosomal protein L24E